MMSLFDWFLADTLLWTGGLLAFVLLVRRPVARQFGARSAYALWALPFLRMVLPPLTLPAWLNPAPLVPAGEIAAEVPVAALVANGVAHAEPIDLAAVQAPAFDWLTPLVALWLVGAAIFLVRRFWLYFSLRDQLLATARPVGEIGKVRLVETATISGPVAFGVIDKVIALPRGFMASHDREARDLAIEHERQHHAGHDLLVNVLVQPLFALHWFNPLGWTGWRALRRDQEAACDARVIARCDRQTKATYATVIASFARRSDATPRPALAAAMACPVLGDKSVIHRLRSLTMSDISPRRRHAGQALFGAALFALPLTATIAYAEAPPPAPPAPPEAPAAPLPPAAPDAPDAPLPPEPPQVPGTVEVEVRTETIGDAPDAPKRTVRIERRIDENGKETVTRRVMGRHHREMTAEESAEFDRDMAELDRELAEQFGPGGELDRDLKEMREELEKSGAAHREMRIAFAESARASAEAGRAAARAGRAAAMAAPEVVISCRNPNSPVTSEKGKDGRTRLFVCKTAGETIRREALARAREAIAADRNLSAEERAEALRSLDEEMAKPRKVSFLVPAAFAPKAPPAPKAPHASDCPEERARASRSA